MAKTAYINTRVDKDLKAKAEKVLSRVGISTTDAITMLLHQIVLRKGLPFDVRIPNAATMAAIEELENGGGEVVKGSTRQLFDEIG